jgi:glycosyltransferase involved in cell wall biosynthesis
MRHVAFVTTELDPHTPGGAGAVVARLSERLRSQGATVTVFLVTDQPVEGTPGLVTVAPEVDEAEPAVARSKAAHRALESFLGDHEVDLIEFQDFDGLAFWSLTHRAGSPLATVPIAIRYHHPADHMLDAIGVERPELDVVRVMERESLAACDAVIVQAPSTIALVDDRYHTGADRIVVGVPPIPAVGRVRVGRSARPRFVVIGRLGEPKGSHDAVRAFAPILERHPEVTLEFVGGDGWSATADLPMTEWLPTGGPTNRRSRRNPHLGVARG